MIKVILADDETLLRDSIKHVIESDKEIIVLASFSNGEEALKACQELNPDIALLDAKMPVLDGISATRKIKEVCPHIKTLILTSFENSDSITESFVAGADGYMVKDIEGKDLISSIKFLYKGIHVVHSSVHKIMVEEFKRLFYQNSLYSKQNISLSETEKEIISLVALGQSNKEIAQKLGYAEGTIKNKISRLFEKLDLNDRTQIAVFAIENNLI